MSGETESSVSGWTTDTLHWHLKDQITDLRLMLQERYATQTKAIDAAFTAQQTAMQTALTAQQTAMRTAFEAADKAVDKALEAAKEAVDQRATTLDKEFHEHLDQVRHENALALTNADKAMQAALVSIKEAVAVAAVSYDKRFEGVNEFRAQLTDQAATFIARTEAEARFTAISEKADGGFARNAERLGALELRLEKVPTVSDNAALAGRVSKIENLKLGGTNLINAGLAALAGFASIAAVIAVVIVLVRK